MFFKAFSRVGRCSTSHLFGVSAERLGFPVPPPPIDYNPLKARKRFGSQCPDGHVSAILCHVVLVDLCCICVVFELLSAVDDDPLNIPCSAKVLCERPQGVLDKLGARCRF